ncbi:MAG: GIY-YIG nuclease family protein [Hyphomicrobium sp.]
MPAGTQPSKSPCVYIIASKPNGVLYIGVTSDIGGRMAEHDQGLAPGMAAHMKGAPHREHESRMAEPI